MAVDIYIEGQRLDLFEDETIQIRSSVQDVRDISKIFADFSQSFTVPASKRNNNIFKRYYNADVVDGYDARIRKDATIDIDTLDFKRGKMSLVEVAIKENQPTHYRIVFYGNTIKIKDLLGDDKLKDLDWLDNFNHDYTYANVKSGLIEGLNFTVDGTAYNKAVCYPLISYKRQFYYNSDSSDDTSDETLVNIAYDASKDNGVKWNELRPALNLPILLQAITEKYGITFTNNFFGSELFKQLYINIYNDKSDELANGVKLYEEESGQFESGGYYRYYTTVTPKAGFENTRYKIRVEVNNNVVFEHTSWKDGTKSIRVDNLSENLNGENYNIKTSVLTESDFEFDATTELKLGAFPFVVTTIFNNSYTNQSVDLNANITRQIKDLKVYDFLTGLLKMFNLIATPEGDDLYINDLQSWYAEGKIYDVTKYIDTKSETVKKANIYNKLAFKFKESKSILANNFKENYSIVYGNLEQRLKGVDGKLIDGDTLEIETIFENPIYERLVDLDTNDETTIQYGLMADENFNSQVGNPFLMYLPEFWVGSNKIGLNDDVGGYESIDFAIMPSHSQQLGTPSFNVNFNVEQNEYTGGYFQDTIYKRFFEDYITDIFSPNRRLFDFDAKLPLKLKNKLKLNDRLVIKDRRYIINSITTNLTDYTEKLELINDIYDAPLAGDVINNSTITPSFEFYSGLSQTDDFKYIGVDGITATKIDTGDGVGWLTLVNDTSSGVVSNISFTIDENLTGLDRSIQIQMVDGVNDPLFTLVQQQKIVQFDNDTITFDDNIITFDNG